jgi:hypothetical protein
MTSSTAKFTTPSDEDFAKAQSLPSIAVNTFSLLPNPLGAKMVFSDGIRLKDGSGLLFPRASVTMARGVIEELHAVLEQYLSGSPTQ